MIAPSRLSTGGHLLCFTQPNLVLSIAALSLERTTSDRHAARLAVQSMSDPSARLLASWWRYAEVDH
jgi:hypothetical protein